MKQILYLKTIIFLICLFPFANVTAQLSTNERPVSFGIDSEMQVKHRSVNTIVTMPELDMGKIEKEDKEDEEKDLPPRFGYRHKVNYNLNNSGTWYELPNGDKLWQLDIVCPNALSVNLCYDKFWIPKGGKFFVYSTDRKQSIGAFTSRNNKGDREHLRGFATGLILGSDVTLEYYQPKEVVTDAVISIEYIVQGYRYVYWSEMQYFGSTGDCMINVNCDEGQNWQEEKNAVACVLLEGTKYCSGSLIITTSLSEAPLFLTACHCVYDVDKDAETDPYLDYTLFYWNYETPGCSNDTLVSAMYSTSAATILANFSYGDFALLRLSEDPKGIPGYAPYYLGWDNSGNNGEPGACIHHPNGDAKKISIPNTQPYSTTSYSTGVDIDGDHWCVTSWRPKQNSLGIVEHGSSGSPLLNASHKIIGQLHGGHSSCYYSVSGPDWFGKFSSAWTGDSSIPTFDTDYKRLYCWLDSLNTGAQTMEGLLIIHNTRTMTTSRQLYSNIRILSTGQLTIQSDIELMGNSKVIVEAGGKLIIDGGTLSNIDIDLKVGATLRIINGGVMESRKGFKAPVGAKVEIIQGKIV
jgi:hypothetical protein